MCGRERGENSAAGKGPICQSGEEGRQPAPVFPSGESHGQRSLAGYSPWGRKGSHMTKHKHTRIQKNLCLNYLQNRNILTDLGTKLTVTKGETWGEVINVGAWYKHTHTTVYIKESIRT